MMRASGRSAATRAGVGAVCAAVALTIMPATSAAAIAPSSVGRSIAAATPDAVLAASLKTSARAAVTAVLVAVARNRPAAARRYLGTSTAGAALWRGLRSEHAWQARLPTAPPAEGGAWRRAGQPWAKAGATKCFRGYCSVFVAVNALGSDGPYTTLYTRRSGTTTKVVAVRDIGPQDAFDYNGAYWACTTRAVKLTNPALGSGTSRLRLRHRALVEVGAYYMQSPSDPTRGVRFSRVVEGYVAVSALMRVPGSVRGEAKARAWCSGNA